MTIFDLHESLRFFYNIVMIFYYVPLQVSLINFPYLWSPTLQVRLADRTWNSDRNGQFCHVTISLSFSDDKIRI